MLGNGVSVCQADNANALALHAHCTSNSVLVLDEATSALDNTTELAVMDAIRKLNSDLTILLIAHRLTTVRHCDFIIELEHGRVVAGYVRTIAGSPQVS